MKAKQFFYAMLVAVALGLGGIFAAFYWGEAQLENKATVISDLQTDRDIAQEKITALQKAKNSTSKQDEATRILATLLPTTKSQETLIADILYTATLESGIPGDNISALSFASSSDPSETSGTEVFKDVTGVFSYPFTMTLQDLDFTTLLKLLGEIETNGRLVQIDNLQISPDKNLPGNISSVTLTMKAFLKP